MSFIPRDAAWAPGSAAYGKTVWRLGIHKETIRVGLLRLLILLIALRRRAETLYMYIILLPLCPILMFYHLDIVFRVLSLPAQYRNLPACALVYWSQVNRYTRLFRFNIFISYIYIILWLLKHILCYFPLPYRLHSNLLVPQSHAYWKTVNQVHLMVELS